MTWNRLRLWLAALGVALMALGLVPIALAILALQSGGALGLLLFVAAMLLSPLLFAATLGWAVVGAAWRGRNVVVMGRSWGPSKPPADPDVLDARFED